MIARHWQGLLIVLTLTGCAPNLDKMKAGTVRVLCRQGRQHALLRFDPQIGQFLLEDCGSANGTFLDSGQRLPPHQPHFLVTGTRFHLSSRAFQFEVVTVKA